MSAINARAFRGDRLRTLRKTAKLSQTQLANRLGAHVTSISDWERGSNAPSGRHVAGLAREFSVPAEHFFADDDEEAARVGDSRYHRSLVDDLLHLARLAEFVERNPDLFKETV